MCVTGILTALFDLLATVWPTILLIDLSRYLIAAGALWALIWGWRPALIWARKIQVRSARPADMLREIRYSLQTVVIFSLNGLVVHFGAGAEIDADKRKSDRRAERAQAAICTGFPERRFGERRGHTIRSVA